MTHFVSWMRVMGHIVMLSWLISSADTDVRVQEVKVD
jgi:hypothetical protein